MKELKIVLLDETLNLKYRNIHIITLQIYMKLLLETKFDKDQQW